MRPGITSPFDAGFFVFVFLFRHHRDSARHPGCARSRRLCDIHQGSIGVQERQRQTPTERGETGVPEPSPRQGCVVRSHDIGTNSVSRGGVSTYRPGELREGFRVGEFSGKSSPVANTLESPPFFFFVHITVLYTN